MSDRIGTIEDYVGKGWGNRAEEFRQFMIECDNACMACIGMSIMDLPDQDFASAFEDEVDPTEFVHDVIAEEIGEML
jgi:hypothetical protein